MKANELRALIDGLTQDITFEYKGIMGAICPFSRSDIAVSYGERSQTFEAVEAVMKSTILGDSLEDICEDIDFD